MANSLRVSVVPRCLHRTSLTILNENLIQQTFIALLWNFSYDFKLEENYASIAGNHVARSAICRGSLPWFKLRQVSYWKRCFCTRGLDSQWEGPFESKCCDSMNFHHILKYISVSENSRVYLSTGSTATFAGYFKVLKRTRELFPFISVTVMIPSCWFDQISSSFIQFIAIPETFFSILHTLCKIKFQNCY